MATRRVESKQLQGVPYMRALRLILHPAVAASERTHHIDSVVDSRLHSLTQKVLLRRRLYHLETRTNA